MVIKKNTLHRKTTLRFNQYFILRVWFLLEANSLMDARNEVLRWIA